MKDEILEKAELNRMKLAKQEAWAQKKLKKEHMEHVVIEEKTYGTGEREKLDYIYPDWAKDCKLPVLIYVHGGGWIAGNKESRRVYTGKFAELGFFVVNLEYDLAPESIFPTQVDQCVRAVDYFLDQAGQLPVNLSRIACGGESAGAYYAAFIAAIAKDKSITEQLNISPMRHRDFDVKANFFNCGAVEFGKMRDSGFPDAELMVTAYTDGYGESRWETISPIYYVKENYPRTYLMYGQLDCLKNNTFYMQEVFDRYHVPYQLKKVTGFFYGNHTASIILMNKKAFRILNEIADFLKEALDE